MKRRKPDLCPASRCPHRPSCASGDGMAESIPHYYVTEQYSLRFDVGAVADDDDAGVGRIEMAARSGQDVGGGEGADFVAESFEVIFRQAVEIYGGKLAEQAILRGDAERKSAGQIIDRVAEFRVADGKRAHAVEFVKDFGERGGDDFVAHGGVDAEIAGVAQRVESAARTVGVTFLFADI